MARPAHPPLTDEEFYAVRDLRATRGRGTGLRAQATLVSRMRARGVYSPEVIWSRAVSHDWIQRAYIAGCWKRNLTATVRKPSAPQEKPEASDNLTHGFPTVNRVSNPTPQENRRESIAPPVAPMGPVEGVKDDASRGAR